MKVIFENPSKATLKSSENKIIKRIITPLDRMFDIVSILDSDKNKDSKTEIYIKNTILRDYCDSEDIMIDILTRMKKIEKNKSFTHADVLKITELASFLRNITEYSNRNFMLLRDIDSINSIDK